MLAPFSLFVRRVLAWDEPNYLVRMLTQMSARRRQ